MSDRTEAEQSVDRLLERSSLGTRGARKLRARTPPEEADLARRISELQVAVQDGSIVALLQLAELSWELGLYQQAETCYRRVAAHSLASVGRIQEKLGQPVEAERWKARAGTL